MSRPTSRLPVFFPVLPSNVSGTTFQRFRHYLPTLPLLPERVSGLRRKRPEYYTSINQALNKYRIRLCIRRERAFARMCGRNGDNAFSPPSDSADRYPSSAAEHLSTQKYLYKYPSMRMMRSRKTGNKRGSLFHILHKKSIFVH